MPEDMKFFREKTSGHPVIMGRKTFESLGKPLPNRRNVVVTRDATYTALGTEVMNSLEDAVNLFKSSPEEVFIIGGAEIYKQAMPIADKLYITHIEATDKDADAFFPEIIPVVWNEISHEEHQPDDKNPFPYTFSVYEKL